MLNGKKFKSMLIYLFLSLLPVIITVIFYYRSIYAQMERELLAAAGQTVNRVAADIDRGVLSALDTMNRLYANEVINELVDKQYDGTSSFLAAHQEILSPSMNMITPINSPVRDYTIFTDNPTVFSGNYLQRIDAPLSDMSWYDPQRDYGGPVFHHSYGQYSITEKKGVMLSLIRSLNMFSNHTRYKKLLKIDFILDYYTSDMELFNGSMYLIDENGIIVVSNGAEQYGEAYHRDLENPGKYLIQSSVSSLPGWIVVGDVNVYGIKNSIMKQQITAIVFIVFITSVLLFIIYKLVSDIFSGRLRETSILLEKRQAQLRALQSQVDPHFIFNMLETVRMKLLLSGEREHSTILMRMARLLRKLMLWKNDVVTIDEEISFINEFMSIQKYCYGERLSWSADVDGDTKACMIPKMLLQTFVENACVHGIRDNGKQTEIRIQVEIRDGLLHCRVSDDGNGLNSETKERLNRLLSGEYRDESGIGIQNAVNRLKLYHGEEFLIKLESEEGLGTNIEISLPVQRNTG